MPIVMAIVVQPQLQCHPDSDFITTEAIKYAQTVFCTHIHSREHVLRAQGAVAADSNSPYYWFIDILCSSFCLRKSNL